MICLKFRFVPWKASHNLFELRCFIDIKKLSTNQVQIAKINFHNYWSTSFLVKKKNFTLWPLFMDGVQLPQGYSHFEEAVYFLPFSSQKFLVLILSTSGGWCILLGNLITLNCLTCNYQVKHWLISMPQIFLWSWIEYKLLS